MIWLACAMVSCVLYSGYMPLFKFMENISSALWVCTYASCGVAQVS